jgi:hypothetical protein
LQAVNDLPKFKSHYVAVAVAEQLQFKKPQWRLNLTLRLLK